MKRGPKRAAIQGLLARFLDASTTPTTHTAAPAATIQPLGLPAAAIVPITAPWPGREVRKAMTSERRAATAG